MNVAEFTPRCEFAHLANSSGVVHGLCELTNWLTCLLMTDVARSHAPFPDCGSLKSYRTILTPVARDISGIAERVGPE